MKQHVMVELFQNTKILETIEGFIFDETYGSVPLVRENLGKEVYLFRGILTDSNAKEMITSLSGFYAMWDDTPVASGFGFGNPSVSETKKSITRTIRETSKKEEFQLFLLHCKNEGKETSFYDKWVTKMDGSKPLPKPVFGKMVNEFGNFYEIEENEETFVFSKSLPK